jgi:hypothetical protein
MSRTMTPPYFHAGQKVVCVDASANQRGGEKLLTRGKIYTIRAIFQEPGWQAPGWGVYLEGVRIVHPDDGMEWPIHPRRLRPVTERPTNIEIFRKLLATVSVKCLPVKSVPVKERRVRNHAEVMKTDIATR